MNNAKALNAIFSALYEDQTKKQCFTARGAYEALELAYEGEKTIMKH